MFRFRNILNSRNLSVKFLSELKCVISVKIFQYSVAALVSCYDCRWNKKYRVSDRERNVLAQPSVKIKHLFFHWRYRYSKFFKRSFLGVETLLSFYWCLWVLRKSSLGGGGVQWTSERGVWVLPFGCLSGSFLRNCQHFCHLIGQLIFSSDRAPVGLKLGVYSFLFFFFLFIC